MQNNKYVSCDWLRNGIGFELGSVELCCFRCHEGGGHLSLAYLKDDGFDIDEILKARDNYIIDNKKDCVDSRCKGCFNLKEDSWTQEPCIKYIHFNHWLYCNSDCIYCYTQEERKRREKTQYYNALPVLKEILKKVKFSPDGEVTFAGGEPTLLNEFDELIEYLLEIGAKKITIHSSGVKYSPVLEKGISENKINIVISQDSASQEIYKKIKNTNSSDIVWENTKKYASFQKNKNNNVSSKYIIIPEINDNEEEVYNWLIKSKNAGVNSVIVDVEHIFYNENKDNISCLNKVLKLCDYIKFEAKNLGLELNLYNVARYLYDRYDEINQYIIPVIEQNSKQNDESNLKQLPEVEQVQKKESVLYKKFQKYKNYFTDLIMLSLPILIGNLGHTLIGATDIFVVAKYNINSLAAISISNAILFTIFIFGLGILDAVSIVISNKRGSRERTKHYLIPCLTFSIFLAFIFSILCYSTKYMINYMNFEAEIVPYIKSYISIVSFSMFGMFLYQGIKQFLMAYEIVKFPNMLLLVAVLINILFDVVFVFGCGPIPAMGSDGAAIATLLVRTTMGLIMLLYVFKLIRGKNFVDKNFVKEIIKIGSPIGAALTFEFLAFNIITVLVGRDASILSATHNIITTISSATFMVPMSIATAVAIKVSYWYGAKQKDEIKRYSYAGFYLGVGFMFFASIILALYPKQLISLFTTNKDVLEIAMPIILIAALYQVFDGFQVIAGGVLRGFKMTKIVSSCVLTGYWVFGFPVAYILVFKYDFSLKGYWIALAVSLFVMGISQALIAKYKFKKVKEEFLLNS